MIWWLWTAFPEDSQGYVHIFEISFEEDEPDVAWLGEVAWTAMNDNMGLGLITS